MREDGKVYCWGRNDRGLLGSASGDHITGETNSFGETPKRNPCVAVGGKFDASVASYSKKFEFYKISP